MKSFLNKASRYLFFTGKGGVGKTSMACATALGLAQRGKRVLLISTDPASNLDEVLETLLSSSPTAVQNVPGLFALNIDPIDAAAEYRERMVGPYRGVLPDAAVTQMEEQLSGACTVEIAGFNEFSKLLGDDSAMRDYDQIVLDTAPTGHTLRLLNLPSAWNDFIASNQTGSSCLGPIAGLKEQKLMFEQVVAALKDPSRTLLVLVSRAEAMSFYEAHRASNELGELGLMNQHLIINGVFTPVSDDPIAAAFAEKSAMAIASMPEELKHLPTTRVPFRPAGVMGVAALQSVYQAQPDDPAPERVAHLQSEADAVLRRISGWPDFLGDLEEQGTGVIMTMGKGGVGKTTMAAAIAAELAQRGHAVVLSTTDPAAHVAQAIGKDLPNLTVERIDPKVETDRYVATVLEKNRSKLSADDMALLEEEMRSPCIEEIAVFQAFAHTVAKGEKGFVVLDTAPTGHTLLLLDATQSYHREVAKSVDELPEAVKTLLPRVRDPKFTKVLIVALPEATPTHEASALQEDLRRAGIEPYGWIVNRCFAFSGTGDPALCAKGVDELYYLNEILDRHAQRVVVSPWVPQELNGAENLRHLHTTVEEGEAA
ncbi:arsenical pump-driving ATPase [Desulfoferrobacter suflitae]|uniref:arsenical pump-driving ATPase n=1 Tax=Desulfoferrobacter suflitae TaxID=2865782 RepID=UPI0021641F14|nr:arsenical pump-driving ATPase [Desulfoferrobacter suflitae]MCK8603686.1 arsenical pump-driving ATPase [Desulfoferrobacter suflitae]